MTNNTHQHVSLLVSKTGAVLSVFASREDAQAQADRYNADPDDDAPYAVQTWRVHP